SMPETCGRCLCAQTANLAVSLQANYRSPRRYIIVIVVGAMGIAAAGLGVARSQPVSTEPEPAQLLRAAYFAAKHNLHSGTGEGTYEYFRAEPGKKDLSLVQKARVKVLFDHDKYHVRLDYEKDALYHMRKRILVYDGTALLSTVFPDSDKF